MPNLNFTKLQLYLCGSWLYSYVVTTNPGSHTL